MEDRAWVGQQSTGATWRDTDMEALGTPTVLLIEDDDDCRALLVTLLQLAGLKVVPCGTAEEALERLREAPYDLVLTDYCLPHRSGGWLLQQACAEGLLESTPAIVVTAHPNPPDVQQFEVICKPFDLDDLVARVRRRLGAPRVSARLGRTARRSASGPGDGTHDDCPHPIEAIIYVSGDSPGAAPAIARVRAALERFSSSRVTLTVRDLSKAGRQVEHGPGGTKTETHGPRTFILGHITNPQLLLELLEGCDEP
jgi:two-component system response regulator FlrC